VRRHLVIRLANPQAAKICQMLIGMDALARRPMQLVRLHEDLNTSLSAIGNEVHHVTVRRYRFGSYATLVCLVVH
jgi:hypothetical protein